MKNVAFANENVGAAGNPVVEAPAMIYELSILKVAKQQFILKNREAALGFRRLERLELHECMISPFSSSCHLTYWMHLKEGLGFVIN